MQTVLNTKVPATRWLHIIPACILIYFMAFLDRSIVSFAIAGGMSKDLQLTASTAGLVGGIFSIGSLLLQVKGADLAKKGRVKNLITITIICWGGLSILTGFAQNGAQLLITRFLLGVAEGGLYPAILVIIGNWFPANERNRANSFFFTTAGVSQIIMGPLAGWILAAFGWRDMYIFLGMLSLVLIFVWLPLIVERPQDAKWLSMEERDYIVNTIAAEQEAVAKEVGGKVEMSKKIPMKKILKDRNVWILSYMNFAQAVGMFGFTMWLPTMFKDLMKTGIANVGYLTMLPNLMVILGLWTWTFISDKSKNRRMTISLPILLFGLCIILSTFIKGNVWISYAALCLAAFSLQGYLGSFWSLPTMILSPEISGASIGFILMMGSIGGFVGPYIVGILRDMSGANGSMWALGLVLISGFLVAFLLPSKLTNIDAKTV